VRDALGRAGFAGSVVTTIGKPEEHEVYIRVPLVPGAKDQDLAPRVVASLKSGQGADAFIVRSQSYIGPTVGRELVKKALGALRDFSFVMVVGIIVGTYSSIYIASPFLVVWQEWLGSRSKKKAAIEAPKVVAKKVRAGKA